MKAYWQIFFYETIVEAFFTGKEGRLESLLTFPLSAENEHVFQEEPDSDGACLLFQRSPALAAVQ